MPISIFRETILQLCRCHQKYPMTTEHYAIILEINESFLKTSDVLFLKLC